MVYRGHLPAYRDLTPTDQERFTNQWADLDNSQRLERLKAAGFDDAKAAELANLDPTAELSHENSEGLWRAPLDTLLQDNVGPTAAAWQEKPDYDQADTGVLSLVVRSKAHGRLFAPVVAWAARWNGWWMWHSPDQAAGRFPSFLTGLFVIGVILALIGAALTTLMREAAARATTEATTRLRRAVYHHTFRLGTLSFRPLGPSEAVTIFTRHVEAVHDALSVRPTTVFREPIKFGLLLAFALVVHFWLALAFLLFAVLVWLIGGQVAAYFRRRSRQATNQAAERLTIIRESLMLMRLVKVYLM